MLRKKIPSVPQAGIANLPLAAICLFLTVSSLANAQGARRNAASASAEEDAPAFHEVRGIQLGMVADEVRKKLGDPKDKSDEQDFFVINDSETAQVLYDKSRKVITISVDFMGMSTTAPTAKQVFGSDIEAKPDGSIYKMVRYPKAGYWLSYNRTAGTSPLTTITLQKIEQ
ncbi:MAG TPA: hypothetical protein VJ124_02930 [Pyrinomonadaceae bacterium]|nr:hypothetical protein [Pyrinomonadaceae bacterium]